MKFILTLLFALLIQFSYSQRVKIELKNNLDSETHYDNIIAHSEYYLMGEVRNYPITKIIKVTFYSSPSESLQNRLISENIELVAERHLPEDFSYQPSTDLDSSGSEDRTKVRDYSHLKCEYESAKYLKLKANDSYVEGMIITKDSTILNGLIYDPWRGQERIYKRVKFISKCGKKVRFYPYSISGFTFLFQRYVSGQNSFYKEELIGSKLSLYSKIVNHKVPAVDFAKIDQVSSTGLVGTPAINSNTKEFYFKKESGSFWKIPKTFFKRNVSEYLFDCENLRTSILNGNLWKKDLKTIVVRYNSCED